jgi:hypothetical protein
MFQFQLYKFLKVLGLCVFTSGFIGFPFAISAKTPVADANQIEIGRRIYMEGILPSGKPLLGKRLNSVQVEGATAACESCHRRSGMGGLEGNIVSPPISGRFLLAKKEDRAIALMDTRAPKNITKAHNPYDLKSFSKTLAEGINVGGQTLNPLMPRYNLNNQEINALIAYLKQLSVDLSPGVGKDSLHFATIITPDVDVKKRETLVSMMRTAFTQRNATQENYSGRMRMPLDLIPRTQRDWRLTVWELQGDASTWEKQLADFYQKDPVFAVISGVSESTWEPVQSFCQQQKLPCLLPSIPLSPAKTDYFTLYYSRGVALEMDVLAKHLLAQEKNAPHRLIQIYRDDKLFKNTAQAFSESMNGLGIQIETRTLPPETAGLADVFKDISPEDALVLWLNPEDLAKVSNALPKLPAPTYLSGVLAQEHYDLIPKSWINDLQVIYPYELGAKRQKVEHTLNAWLKTWKLPLVNAVFQSEVFFNLLFVTDLTSQMLDNLYRDYMIERAEDMLSLGTNVSAYPHLSLARGQRIASKGAYIARIDQDGKLKAYSDWIVP